MPWKYSVLVIANVTAGSDELLDALKRRAEKGSARFTLLVPATGGGRGGREAAEARLETALERMRSAGLEITGRVGDSDPVAAVYDVWDPRSWDEIVVATLSGEASRWLEIDLPRRVERITGMPVTHVVAHEPRTPPPGTPPPEHDRWGVLAPLQPLSWGSEGERTR
jgi:hypothetical protein